MLDVCQYQKDKIVVDVMNERLIIKDDSLIIYLLACTACISFYKDVCGRCDYLLLHSSVTWTAMLAGL